MNCEATLRASVHILGLVFARRCPAFAQCDPEKKTQSPIDDDHAYHKHRPGGKSHHRVGLWHFEPPVVFIVNVIHAERGSELFVHFTFVLAQR